MKASAYDCIQAACVYTQKQFSVTATVRKSFSASRDCVGFHLCVILQAIVTTVLLGASMKVSKFSLAIAS